MRIQKLIEIDELGLAIDKGPALQCDICKETVCGKNKNLDQLRAVLIAVARWGTVGPADLCTVCLKEAKEAKPITTL